MNSMQSGRVLMIRFNIQTSLRGSKSISIAATHAFVEAYRTAHPDVTADNLNVWEEGFPEFDSEAIGGRAGLEPTEEEVRHAPENPGPTDQLHASTRRAAKRAAWRCHARIESRTKFSVLCKLFRYERGV